MRWVSSVKLLFRTGDEHEAHGHRAVQVRQLALVWELLSALAVAACAGLYARYQAWQALAALGLAFLAAVLCRVSRRLSLLGRIGPAGVLLLVVGVVAPIVATSLMPNVALLSAAFALVLPAGIVALVWPWRRPPWALLLGAIGALLCVLSDRMWSWDRLNAADVSLYVLFVAGLAAVALGALLWLLAGTPPGPRLRTRLFFSFLIVGALPAASAGMIVAAWPWLLSGAVAAVASQGHTQALVAGAALWPLIAGLGLGGIAFSVALAFRLTKRIADPFRALADRACEADHGGPIGAASTCDEVEELARALDAIELREQALQSETEEEVSRRTRELEQRCRYAEALAEISRVSLNLLDVRRLSRALVNVVRDRLALQYVGLYTLCSGEVWADLCADSASAGWRGPDQPSQTRVGEGLVGRAIGQAELVVATRSGATEEAGTLDTVHGIPVRAALPLRSRGQVLGALIVHTGHPDGLSRELLDVLQAMANHAALALDNARTVEESQEALAAAQRASGKLSLGAWAEIVRARTDLGFRSDEGGVQRAEGVWHPRMACALQDNVTVLGRREGDDWRGQSLTVPIRIQGEVIGVLDTRKPDRDGVWTTDQVALVEQIAEQLSQALEHARLYEETQRRGMRERQLREIGTRIGSGVDLDTILQTAIEDVAKALGVPAAFVQLYEGGPPAPGLLAE
ncbi:MAG TPA: GAF domain-containing protein [Anaerolineae bacterium]|nr:GAF domain-containing protein [Anaerolineae bacterium]